MEMVKRGKKVQKSKKNQLKGKLNVRLFALKIFLRRNIIIASKQGGLCKTMEVEMEYLTTSEMAEKWNISRRRVRKMGQLGE